MSRTRRLHVLVALLFCTTVTSAAARPVHPSTATRAESVVATREVARLDQFSGWLAKGQARGLIGEVGWPGNPGATGDQRWNGVARTWYRAAATRRLMVAAWATGEIWPRTYKLAVYSARSQYAPVDQPNPQAAVIEEQGSTRLRGINVDGGAFGEYGAGYDPVAPTSPLDNVDVGTYGSTYAYPSAATFRFLASRGIPFVRLAFRWERVQRSPGGRLDPTELARLRASIDAANRSGLQVILDCHNYGAYYLRLGPHGVRRAIGSADVPVTAFADLWRRLATAFAGNRAVLGYGLMNEPTGMTGPQTWERASRAAVAAIRGAGDRHRVFVSSYGWGSVTQFAAAHPRGPWIRDAAHATWYEAHQYFDRDMSAHYRLSLDAEARAAAAARNPRG
jgi:Cellulase (glycosyl hydrolase family 5)